MGKIEGLPRRGPAADALTAVRREQAKLRELKLGVTGVPYDWALKARGR